MFRLGVDHNPIRRPVDRVETAVRIGLAVVFLLLVPAVIVGVGHHLETSWRHAEQAETAKHRVTATLLGDAPTPIGRFGAAPTKVLVHARWLAPDGSPRTGDVHAVRGEKAGATTSIWIDGAGRSVDPPIRHSQLTGQKAIASVLVLSALLLALIGAGQAVRHVLDRRRMAAWDADWSAVEPRWTGRTPRR